MTLKKLKNSIVAVSLSGSTPAHSKIWVIHVVISSSLEAQKSGGCGTVKEKGFSILTLSIDHMQVKYIDMLVLMSLP